MSEKNETFLPGGSVLSVDIATALTLNSRNESSPSASARRTMTEKENTMFQKANNFTQKENKIAINGNSMAEKENHNSQRKAYRPNILSRSRCGKRSVFKQECELSSKRFKPNETFKPNEDMQASAKHTVLGAVQNCDIGTAFNKLLPLDNTVVHSEQLSTTSVNRPSIVLSSGYNFTIGRSPEMTLGSSLAAFSGNALCSTTKSKCGSKKLDLANKELSCDNIFSAPHKVVPKTKVSHLEKPTNQVIYLHNSNVWSCHTSATQARSLIFQVTMVTKPQAGNSQVKASLSGDTDSLTALKLSTASCDSEANILKAKQREISVSSAPSGATESNQKHQKVRTDANPMKYHSLCVKSARESNQKPQAVSTYTSDANLMQIYVKSARIASSEVNQKTLALVTVVNSDIKIVNCVGTTKQREISVASMPSGVTESNQKPQAVSTYISDANPMQCQSMSATESNPKPQAVSTNTSDANPMIYQSLCVKSATIASRDVNQKTLTLVTVVNSGNKIANCVGTKSFKNVNTIHKTKVTNNSSKDFSTEKCMLQQSTTNAKGNCSACTYINSSQFAMDSVDNESGPKTDNRGGLYQAVATDGVEENTVVSDENSASNYCNICKKNYPLRSSYVRHMRKFHPEEKLTFLTRSRADVFFKDFTNIKLDQYGFHCDLCELVVANLTDFTEHYKNKHNESSPFVCFICAKRFAKPKYLKEHARVHSESKSYMCPHCGIMFKRNSGLFYHIAYKHSSEPRFQCSYCGKEFVEKSKLKFHVDSHFKS